MSTLAIVFASALVAFVLGVTVGRRIETNAQSLNDFKRDPIFDAMNELDRSTAISFEELRHDNDARESALAAHQHTRA